MKTLSIILLALLTMNTVHAQEGNTSLQAFENLVGGIWEGKGAWSNGTPFHQQISFEWGLTGKMIKVKTYGNVSREGYEFGLRNEGVRMWSEETSEVKFWEFDIFGGVTDGAVETDGDNIYYRYIYETGQGQTELTDAWIHQDENTYEYIVGVYQNGEWIQRYLSTAMKRIE
jgi:hypothetical protein